jgi:hypothetical protein
MGKLSKARKEEDTTICLLIDRNYDNGDLHQAWMVVH